MSSTETAKTTPTSEESEERYTTIGWPDVAAIAVMWCIAAPAIVFVASFGAQGKELAGIVGVIAIAFTFCTKYIATGTAKW